MTALVLLVVLVGLGIAAVLDRTADSRDSTYNLGAVLHPHARRASGPANR